MRSTPPWPGTWAAPPIDLVLTTYALLPRDEAVLREQRFRLLILDESQYIKNGPPAASGQLG